MADVGGQGGGGKRKSYPPIELNITTILDIIITLLFFMIQNQDLTNFTPSVPKGINPPRSESKNLNHHNLIVRANENEIYVGDNKVARNPAEIVTDLEGKRIIPLFNELVKHRESVEMVNKAVPNSVKFDGALNLIVDKSVKYAYLKQILFTAASAGYSSYQFVVYGEE
jgi:biopolymer transport protein ExbD